MCHLLYYMTRREDVQGFRVQQLLNLQQRVGTLEPPLVGLISIFRLYRPSLVPFLLPKT